MNPNQGQDTGSFGAPAGGMTSALSQVMNQVQSGQYVPQQSQVTNTAPGAPQSGQPLGAPNMPPTAPASPAPTSSSSVATQGTPTLPFDSAESKMLIGALSNRLKAGTDYHHASMGIHSSQQPPKVAGGI